MNCWVWKTGRLSSDIASEIHDSPNHPTEGILCRSSSLIFDRCWLLMSGMHRDAPGGFRISQSAVGKCHNCCWEPCSGRRGKVKLEGWKLVHKIGATLICPHAANNQYPLIDKIKVHSKDIQAANSRWIPGDTGILKMANLIEPCWIPLEGSSHWILRTWCQRPDVLERAQAPRLCGFAPCGQPLYRTLKVEIDHCNWM